jgi:hypothetical protein
VIWAGHFLACYASAAVFCARFADGGLGTLRLALAAITVLALAGIVFAGILAWRQWGFGTGDPPHDDPTRQDRLLFQGFATLLLAGLSFVAVAYQALPVAFITDCGPCGRRPSSPASRCWRWSGVARCSAPTAHPSPRTCSPTWASSPSPRR